jgi:hypothetical protein
MKARTATRGAALSALLLAFIQASDCSAQYRTTNFVVYAPQPAFAKQVGDQAEKFRKELSVRWLGEELPAWPEPCPITVEIAPHAGGETSFAFSPGGDGRSRPFDWRMKIYGSPERILDSVLPHEVTHTIFATHYGRPLPRWADEGACTTVEHDVEKKKNHQMLMQFLTTNRGIPFNHMFAMKQYPRDILPLYAQGYSLAKYLIMQKGHRHFVNFVGAGMQREVPGREPQTWNEVTKQFYGYDDLSDLQVRWLAWVREGSPRLNAADTEPAESAVPGRPGVVAEAVAVNDPLGNAVSGSLQTLDPGESWYVRQSRLGGNATMQRPDRDVRAAADSYQPGSIRRSFSDGPAAKANTVWR